MNRAGEETFIMNVFRNIDREKIMFDFLVTGQGEGDYDNEIKKLGGNIYHVKLNRINGKLKHLDNIYVLSKKLKSLKNNYDYFHIHTQHAMDAYTSTIAAKMAGITNVVVHSHNSRTEYSVKVHALFKFLLGFEKITRFACGSDAGIWMFGKKKFTIINNGIDLTEFKFNEDRRKTIRKKMGWDGKFVVGHVGRFSLQKNHEYLLNVFKEYKSLNSDARLVLVGDGELREKIEMQVVKLNLEKYVQFLGKRSDMADLYQGFDVFAFPSLFEGLPVVLIETQTSDLPAIISNSITNEVIINKNIYNLSLSNNEGEWVSFLDKIASENASRQDRTRDIALSGYDIKDVAQKLAMFYTKGMI